MPSRFKFRVWDKKTNKFLKRNWGCFESGDYIYAMGSILDGDFKHLTPQQFAGLQDKNGKDIYEGDILKIDYTHRIVNKTRIVEVKHFVSTYETTGEPDLVSGFTIETEFEHDVEIIGNIFENPELLKK